MTNTLSISDTIKKSPEQQREELLRLNNDILYGVYEIILNLYEKIQLKLSNNTFEYRSLREIQLPNGINPRQRLFLESQNQYAKTHRLESLARENLVPTMKNFAEKVKEIIK